MTGIKLLPLIAMAAASCVWTQDCLAQSAAGSNTQSAAGSNTQSAAGASAQAASAKKNGVEEVVVTGTKRALAITKVPMSIVAFSKAQMDVQGVRTAADIAALTPGFDIETQSNPTGGGPSSGGNAEVSIRGIASLNGDATTGIYIDDTAIQVRNTLNGTSGSTFPRVFDLQSVEIDRGPQGTLFGAAAEGGAVRFITPDPSLTDYTGYARSEIAGTLGGGLSDEAGLAVGGPIVPDKLGFRLSAWYRNDGGFVDRQNWETGQNFPNDNWQNTQAYKAALTLAPTEWLKITPSLYYQYQHSNDTSVFWTSLSDFDSGKFINGNAVQLPYTDKYTLPTLKVQATLDDLTITGISSYFVRTNTAVADETNSEYASDGFASTPSLNVYFPTVPNGYVTAPLSNTTTQTEWTEELRLQNTNHDDRLNWLVGAFYSDYTQHDVEYESDKNFAQVLGELGTSPIGYFGFNPLPGNISYFASEKTAEYQLAAYANLSYRLFDGVTASAGVRVARDRLAYFLFGDGPGNGGPATTTGDQKGTPVTPRFSLTWQVTPNDMLYTTVAQGYRIGGVNAPLPVPLCSQDLANIGLTQGPKTYGADSLWSYEIGEKSRLFDGRVQLEASAFHIDWSQIQQKVVLPICTFAFTENSGAASVNGFDFKATARVTPQLLLGLSVGYTDAKYDDTLSVGKSIAIAAGDTLGQTPWDVIVSAEYDFVVMDGKNGFFRVEDIFHSENSGPYTFQHSDAYDFDPTLEPNPATNQLNIRTGTRFAGFDISLFGNNLLNAHPRLDLAHATFTSPVYVATTLRPLTVGLTATYHF
jgi:outer membrane receptor protein involved in Fe transport